MKNGLKNEEIKGRLRQNRIWFYLWNIWPPFVGAGISVQNISADLLSMRVVLKNRFWTKTLAQAQFGGSLFAMTDPIYASMWWAQLGPEYTVWDHSASIQFLRPVKGEIFADFQLGRDEIQQVKNRLENESKILWQRQIEIRDASGQVMAQVQKTIYLKKKREKEK